ncbi:hypothetical protein WJX74_000916 [Apatococcus lobatus]|uniref:Hexosyltransferase n=1 Tax=Apatococcus lobatus TaxID=904363 RepID=A0AAW1S1R6_9CHLO
MEFWKRTGVIISCVCLSDLVSGLSFEHEITTEHFLEARGSLPKRDVRRDPLFLLIGLMSTLEATERRETIRHTWGSIARHPPSVDYKFFLEAEDEQASKEEQSAFNDLTYVDTQSDYRTSVIKTYKIMEYSYIHLDCRFILKADDDTYINVIPLVQELQQMCRHQDCRHAKLYIGQMNQAGAIRALHMPDGQPSQYYNAPYHARTGLEYYPHYMVGGGYIVTQDIAAGLVAVNSFVGLKVFHLEDANFGFWLSPLNVHYVNHPQFSVLGQPSTVREVYANGSSVLRVPGPLFLQPLRALQGLNDCFAKQSFPESMA